MKTVRLIYPQWQGANISSLVPELNEFLTDSSIGYHLGAQLLTSLAPSTNQLIIHVPISTEVKTRKVIDGILDRDVILKQTQKAIDLLNESNPDKIVTIGGECSVSVAPFTYLANKYQDDLVVVWIDAHPDITLPGDVYSGFHAMALSACMGYGDEKICATLPATINASNVLLVGLKDWEREEIKVRQKEYGLKHVLPEEVASNTDVILNWLRNSKASKVAIHFDLDVLDSNEIVVAAGSSPNGMKIAEVVRVINDIATEKELVGLTIAEPIPRTALRIKNMLAQLPLFDS